MRSSIFCVLTLHHKVGVAWWTHATFATHFQFLQLCHSRQDFNWHCTLHCPSATWQPHHSLATPLGRHLSNSIYSITVQYLNQSASLFQLHTSKQSQSILPDHPTEPVPVTAIF